LVLDSDALIHARVVKGKRGLVIEQAKSYRIASDAFAPDVVTPRVENEAAIAEVLRRLKLETGRWDKASLLLPDSWFRINILELLGLNIWNAITFREPPTTRDRVFFYVRDNDFTTAAFRGAQPLFIRSRNLNGERSLAQEIKLSASYLRDTLQTGAIENCYLAGNVADGTLAATVAAEFQAPVRTLSLSDVAEQTAGESGAYEA